MKRFNRIVTQGIIAGVVIATTLAAADVELVGTIDDGLHSPTSLEVSADGIAVLEPYSSQIKLYTVGGVINQQINLIGEPHALTRIGQDRYLYCDRGNRKIISVDLSTDNSTEFLAGGFTISDPVDLLVRGDLVSVLDGERSTILTFDLSGSFDSEISLLDENQQPLPFASSFDYSAGLDRYYVLEQTRSTIYVYDASGQLQFQFASFGNRDGETTRGGEIAIDRYNRIFVSDRFQGRVVSFDAAGRFLVNIGGADGLPSMNIPTGLDIDEEGLIYVSSTMSAKILVFYSSIFASGQSIAVQQIAPEDQAELSSGSVRLVGLAETSDPNITITGLEFELFTELDGQTELIGNHLAQLESTAGGNTGLTADWELTEPLPPGQSYTWHTRVIWDGGVTEWTGWRGFSIAELPNNFTLEQNYPNPFNPETKIRFSLAQAGQTELVVYNLLGEKVAVLLDQVLEAGEYEETFSSQNAQGKSRATGVYFYRLVSGNHKQTRKMLLLK